MRTNQLCLGVAVAGVMSLGSLAAAAVADADTSAADTAPSSSSQSTESDNPPTRSRSRTANDGPAVRVGARNSTASQGAAGSSERTGLTDSAVRAPAQIPATSGRSDRVRPAAAAVSGAALPKGPAIDLPKSAAPVDVVEAVASASPPAEAVPSSLIRPAADQAVAVPIALAGPAALANTPVRPAPAPIPIPALPVPAVPVLPAGAVAVPTSTAAGRNRSVSAAVSATVLVEDQQELLAGPAQHVLLIGIDGTDLSSILADSYNQNLFDLMNGGTTAASTMVGHTTISNPSWTGILTGVWSETAGVANNVFSPWTYDTWPTVFNQLETYDPVINTTSIANWSVIAQISGAGSIPADSILYYPKINDSWEETDDAVGLASVESILNTDAGVPSFQFTYFVGVDETGHDYGGSGTPEYAAALRNVDDNIGDIMAAVEAWELANPGEEWTVIVTTDHGQAAERPGFIVHGFQTPAETTTFVIGNGQDFVPGAVNNTYVNIDVTPTVMQLFGIAPEPYSEGKPLMDRADSDYLPVLPGQDALHLALTDAIAMYGYPDIVTNLALGVRTIATTVPYIVYTLFDGWANSVPEFLQFGVELIGAVIYQIVNIPAQIIARLTGVTGNNIIPPQWWPYNPIPGVQPGPSAVVPAPVLICDEVCLAS
jgi:hypothetical protein